MRHKLFYIAAALLCMAGCTKKTASDLKLGGDCLIQTISLDNFEGTIDLTARSIVVRLPEVYATSSMEITELTLSNGATCNVVKGQKLNMDAAKGIHVSNGDASIDWTLSVLHDEARILHFVLNDIYTGTIDQEAKTISAFVPKSEGINALVPTIVISQNATISPLSGVPQDFTEPVQYTVTNNSAKSVYTVNVTAIDKPKALFIGEPAKMNDLDPEAGAACQWMLSNVPGALYTSFADFQAGTVELDECQIIWWHYHMDGGVDGHDNFVAKAPYALEAKNQLRAYYENGGAFLLTRYATNLPSFIGATGDDEWTTPNNCWGKNEDSAERCWGPWDFNIFGGQNEHPLFSGLIAGDDPNKVYCTDNGYYITNSTAQYHIRTDGGTGDDWGDYKDHAAWEARTGGKILGVGGDGAIVAWEYPAKDGKGGIICIGSGCYDWYSYMFEPEYEEHFHKNIATMTKNAINYLTK